MRGWAVQARIMGVAGTKKTAPRHKAGGRGSIHVWARLGPHWRDRCCSKPFFYFADIAKGIPSFFIFFFIFVALNVFILDI